MYLMRRESPVPWYCVHNGSQRCIVLMKRALYFLSPSQCIMDPVCAVIYELCYKCWEQFLSGGWHPPTDCHYLSMCVCSRVCSRPLSFCVCVCVTWQHLNWTPLISFLLWPNMGTSLLVCHSAAVSFSGCMFWDVVCPLRPDGFLVVPRSCHSSFALFCAITRSPNEYSAPNPCIFCL